MPRTEYIEKLREAIRETEYCDSKHVKTVPVTQYFEDKVGWSGEVEVFDLFDHTKARRCYAWSHEEQGATLATIVLKLPPVDSPESAVKVAIAAKGRSDGKAS